jgi:hypothetical protein
MWRSHASAHPTGRLSAVNPTGWLSAVNPTRPAAQMPGQPAVR